MPADIADIVQKPLLHWIFSGNRLLQSALVAAAFLAVFANILPLEMQKRIVNEAINLREIDLLMSYCVIYLAAVVTAAVLKYLINTLQNVIGQRATARMRKELYGHTLTLPLSFYRRTQPGLVVAALSTELATAGDFIGMAIAVPVTNLLMALVFAGYLVWLNPLLAAISFAIYPVVLLLVPVLQKRVNRYNRKRVDAGREVSGKIGESVEGVHEIQVNSAFDIEQRKFARLVDRLCRIRIVWNLYRQGIKRLNGLFTNFSRFLIFAVGGYLAINGRLELGALVAFLSAQEKLYSPWKELIQFYEAYQTASVTYKRTMGHFDRRPEHPLAPDERDPYQLEGNVEAADLSYATEEGARLLSGIDFDLKHGEQMALVGFSGSGKSTLAQCLVQLYSYSDGSVKLGGEEVSGMTKMDIACNTGFVSQTPFIFAGTIDENLVYAHQSMAAGKHRCNDRRSPGLDDKILVLQQTGLFLDVLGFGLNGTLDPDENAGMARRILRVRREFRKEAEEELGDILEVYQPDRFLDSSSIAENLLFADALQNPYSSGELSADGQFRSMLNQLELMGPLLALGAELTRELVERSDSRRSEGQSFEFDLIAPDRMEDFKKTLRRFDRKGGGRLGRRDAERLLSVALDFTPNQHPLAGMSERLKNRIVKGRTEFRKLRCDPSRWDSIDAASCRESDYLFSQSILTNILYGKVKTDWTEARHRIQPAVHRHLVESELLEEIIELGLQYPVGTKGDNLSGGQRQKLAIARVFLKTPALLIMDEATSGLDNDSQARIQQLIETQWKGKSTVISVAHRLDTIKHYDQVAVMKGGEIVERGGYEELMDQKGVLFELVSRAGRQ
jgi:ABC-type bacteriocin/lantibiotic exporter with double-glycine peptidase domain